MCRTYIAPVAAARPHLLVMGDAARSLSAKLSFYLRAYYTQISDLGLTIDGVNTLTWLRSAALSSKSRRNAKIQSG